MIDPNNNQPTMNANLKYMAMAIFAVAAITGCKPDEDDVVAPPPLVNELEVLTTLRVHFASTGGTEHREFRFFDADGDGGGSAPVITADTLSNDTMYNVGILVLNETVFPADTISMEILEEGADHQFFFQTTGASVAFVYADADVNGNPIGLLSTATASTAGTGTLKVTLIHEGDKSAPGVSGGDITNIGGETDIEVTFPLVIE